MVDVLKIPTERLLDPRLSLKQNANTFGTNMSGSQINYRRQASNSSSGNTSNLTFHPVINTTSVLDRRLLVEVNFRLTFTGTTTGTNLLQSGCDAPRSLGAIISNTQLSINTQSITQESRYVNHWLARFEEHENMSNALSIAPYMSSPDAVQQYESAFGSNQFNSLGDFNSGSVNDFGRGLYKVNIISNTPTSAVVDMTLFDYVYLSPMVYDNSKLYQGIPNISSLELQFTFQQIQRIWSHSNAGGSTINSLEVEINQGFLNFVELTPPPQVQIPASVTLPYHEIERRLTNCNLSIPAGGTSNNLFSNTYTLNTIPLKAVIFAKERNADIQTLEKLINTPDVYGSIQKISIQYANQTALFSNCNAEQLYSISSRNGYKGSVHDFRGETQVYSDSAPNGYENIGLSGSVFCFDFGRDISCPDGSLLPGVASNVIFSVTEMVVKNTSGRTIVYDVEVFFVYDSIFEIELGKSKVYRSLLLPSEVMDYPITESMSEEPNIHGGSFKGMLKKALTGLKTSPALRKGASALADAFVPQPERDMLRKYTGVGVVGNGVSGNALIKKRNLKDRM